jgi:hypothetical protein
MTRACAHYRGHLGAYADGELKSADRQVVARHLAECEPCGQALGEIREVGAVLRSRNASVPEPVELEGVMAGVISRTRAEASQSWSAVYRRATGDWHWALTGFGSLSAAIASLVIVAIVCSVNPHAERDDSLAAMLKQLEQPATGMLFIMATPVGRDQAPMLMKVGGGRNETPMESVVLPLGFAGPSRSDLALALTETLVRPDGRVGTLGSMSQNDRQQTEALLGEIRRRRMVIPAGGWSGQFVNVEAVAFVTNTRVRG